MAVVYLADVLGFGYLLTNDGLFVPTQAKNGIFSRRGLGLSGSVCDWKWILGMFNA